LLAGSTFTLIPAWLQEGSADYFSTHEGADRGIETVLVPDWPNPPQTLTQKRASAAQQVRASSQPLAAFEGRPPDGIQPIAYAFGNVATELLVQNYGRPKAVHDIYSSISPSKDWKQAFP